MLKRWVVLIIIGSVLYLFSQCENRKERTAENTYLNLSDTVNYVGIETCKKCHYDKWETFLRTGMGSSFGMADTSKSIARLADTSHIYDPHLNFHYHPFWRGDSLFLKEYRLHQGDTLYNLLQYVDYVVGSGQHTNSHIYNREDHLYQLPFTWYAQKGKLDLPPGYEDGGNNRFNRIIGLECMSCHNAMPTGFVKGSENKFSKVPVGIDCERCHGPGEVHVQRMMAGNYADTTNGKVDYSIVNPSKLSVELQFEVCQRCHLQGNAVLAEGKSFFDFRPGMKLKEVMDVYLPRYEEDDSRFIMASHVDRFKQSKCFQKQGEADPSTYTYNCTSCHDPHISVKEVNILRFNDPCKKCHVSKDHVVAGSGDKGNQISGCTEKEKVLAAAEYNCVKCHMPSSSSTDIPHVTVHDHYVRKPDSNVLTTRTKELGQFLGLAAVNNEDVSDRSKAVAYLQQYERFNKYEMYLDSAFMFINRIKGTAPAYIWIHYYFLKEDYPAILSVIRKDQDMISHLDEQSYDNKDAWTAYRIGEAFYNTGQAVKAEVYYKRAVELAPYVIDFRNKYATVLLKQEKTDEAEEQFGKVLNENPGHKEALNNLGYCYLLKGNYGEAEHFFRKSLKQDPDYLMAWLNIANIHLQQQNSDKLKSALQQVLRIDPDHAMATRLMQQLE